MGEEIKQLILRVMAIDRKETCRALLISSKKSSKLKKALQQETSQDYIRSSKIRFRANEKVHDA